MCLSLPEFLSILRILNSESRFSILQLVWNRLETSLENEGICIIGCLMLWRCFQYELNSLITRIFTRFVHRNSKRRSYYRHRRQAADLPAKVAKRIGCAHKRDVLSRLDGALFLVEFLVRKSWSIYMSPFHARQLILPCARRGHVIFQDIPSAFFHFHFISFNHFYPRYPFRYKIPDLPRGRAKNMIVYTSLTIK